MFLPDDIAVFTDILIPMYTNLSTISAKALCREVGSKTTNYSF